MTYLEKYLQSCPYSRKDFVVKYKCPCELFDNVNRHDDCTFLNGGSIEIAACERCWNREIPAETEEKEDYLKPIKAELDALKAKMKKFERKKAVEETAEELYEALEVMMKAGFTREEAFQLLLKSVK